MPTTLPSIFTPLRKYCHQCNFWKWEPTIYLKDGSSAYPGHCAIVSARCINAMANGDTPPDFMKLEIPDEAIEEEST